MKIEIKNKLKGGLAVLLGGSSAERSVSLDSGEAVLNALRSSGLKVERIDTQDNDWLAQIKSKNIKHVFIALHGGDGEDGTIQGALEILGVTYTGSGVLGSALGMDKMRCKQLWQGIGINTADYASLKKASNWHEVIERLGGKCIVKPAQEGSSIGMQIATDEESLEQAYAEAVQYGTEVIAERWIDGPEYTVALLGEQVLPVIEMQTDNEFYDFVAKYEQEDTRYICPCGLSKEEEDKIKSLSLAAFKSLNCEGWGRVDVMVDQRTNTPYVLEVNTSPGMTSHSLVPMAAAAAGLNFEQLVVTILALSLD